MLTWAQYTTHGDRTALRCAGLCNRRKAREEFRETAWHGRSSRCRDCEDGRAWDITYNERQSWLLQQERERTQMLRRHVARLTMRRDEARGEVWELRKQQSATSLPWPYDPDISPTG